MFLCTDTTRTDPVIILAATLGSVIVFGIAAVIVTVIVIAVLVYCFKTKDLKLSGVRKMLSSVNENVDGLPEDERKRLVRNLNKAYIKLLFPRQHIEFDSAEDGDDDPVSMFTQFLRHSFVQGFKSENKEKYFEKFRDIKKVYDRCQRPSTAPQAEASSNASMERMSASIIRYHKSPEEITSGVIEMYDYGDEHKSTEV